MNKKLNTLFFIIGATVFNLLIMLVLMVISLALVGVIFKENLNPNILSVLMMVILVVWQKNNQSLFYRLM